MNKLIFTIAFFTLCATARAQINKDTVGLNLPVKDNQLIYTGVVEINGKTKDDLFRNAQQWFIDNFYSQKGVIQDKDKEAGLIFGRGAYYYSSKSGIGYINWASNITVEIECKDNKYRYWFYHMVISNYDSGNSTFDIEQLLGTVLGTQKWPWTKSAAKNALVRNDEVIKSAIVSLKNAMETTVTDF
jgi:hypothetical protein